jgi:phospholipase C
MWDRLEQREISGHALQPGPAERPRPDQPAGADLIPQIKHIVVLMMENHSYDNYLGMLSGRGDGFPLAPDGQPDVFNDTADGETIRAFPLPSTVQHQGVPSQSWHATHQQWGEGKCDGFVTSAQEVQAEARADTAADPVDTAPETATVGLGYWSERDLPFYYGLARTFPLADRWFSSCLGPTFPNRRFLIAGTARGLIDDSPYDLLDYPPAGTIFDLLTEHGISWADYHPVASGQPRWRHYARHSRKMTGRRLRSAVRALPAVSQGAHKDIQFTADVFPLGIGRYMQHVRGLDQFFADAARGTLPAFSIVDPDFGAYSEENPQDIRKGESFAAEVINRVMHGAGWPHTVLIWVYDEHGGYYDHVPPPPAIPPDDVEGRSAIGSPNALTSCLRVVAPGLVQSKENLNQGPQRYDRYGFRVPAVIVSPYARAGYVCSQTFDHTSVLKLVQEKWNLPALTARDAAARAPLDALDLTGEPAFLKPPVLPEPSLRWGTWQALGLDEHDHPDIRAWSQALRQTGRPIIPELSDDLALSDAAQWSALADGWRTGLTMPDRAVLAADQDRTAASSVREAGSEQVFADLWTGRSAGTVSRTYLTTVAPGGVTLISAAPA